MLATELPPIIQKVNAYIPNHGVGVIDPSQIAVKRRANCLGTQMPIVAVLLERDLTELSNVFMLISRTHGMSMNGDENATKHMFGHIITIVDNGVGDREFIDVLGSEHRARIRGSAALDDIQWNRNLDLASVWFKEYTNGPPVSSAIRAVSHLFTVHSLEDGLITYQNHPRFRFNKAFKVEDYSGLWQQIINAEMPPEAMASAS